MECFQRSGKTEIGKKVQISYNPIQNIR